MGHYKAKNIKTKGLRDSLQWRVCYAVLFVLLSLMHPRVWAQKMSRLDSIKSGKINLSQNKFINNILRQAVNSVEKTPDNSSFKYLNSKSEDPFKPYQGKIIRKIRVNSYNFDQTLKDTTRHDKSGAASLGKKLHTKSKDFVIYNDLFIRENMPLNPYKLADNERYLRTLSYIHDARIVVRSLQNNPDSVDIDVFTVDLFSLAGGFSSNGLNHVIFDEYENNLGGMGQRLDVTQLYDYSRHPDFGYGITYTKENIAHTFINGSGQISTMSGNPITSEEESVRTLSLSRPLVSPYTKVAGGITLSNDVNYNLYNAPVVDFYKYKYDYFDVWGGYNVGIGKLTATVNSIRDRRFLSFRYYNRDFRQLPAQVSSFNPVFNSTSAALAQMTFFRQDYYRTQYIYGFGTTEDLPYGYNVNVTAGWHRQLNLERFYSGVNLNQYIATNNGDFIQLYAKTGGFLYKGKIQDGALLLGATAYSRLMFWNTTKIRQYLNLSYSCLNSITTYAPLRLNNYFGVNGFLTDSAQGNKRLSLQAETYFYVKFNVWGFHFAPFPFVDLSLLKPIGKDFDQSNLYSSFGGGVRMRNENLVFETIELRAYYFPVTPDNMKGFKIVLNSNLRYRYTSNLIAEPDILQLNSQ